MVAAKYQFVGRIPRGSGGDGTSDTWEKTVTACVIPGWAAAEEWQLYVDTKLVHFQTA